MTVTNVMHDTNPRLMTRHLGLRDKVSHELGSGPSCHLYAIAGTASASVFPTTYKRFGMDSRLLY